MEVLDPKLNSISSKTKEKVKSNRTQDQERELCPHCKRTASNGIRCMGICVADSDY